MSELRDKTETAIQLSAAEARAILRRGGWTDLTEGFAQTSVHLAPVFVPAADAAEVLAYCGHNPLAAPVVAVLPAGVFTTELASGGDVRTDVARYEIWQDGRLSAEVDDLLGVWRDDIVTIFIGTSHILAAALKEGGVAAATVDNPRPAIYRTARPTVATGRLAAPLHVTVKFAQPEEVATIERISARLPAGHGAPVHAGDPAQIGVIGDPPAFGMPLEVPPGAVPVFWACSFSLLAALRAAPLAWFACSAPGCTFITDRHWRTLLQEPAEAETV